MYAFMDGKIVEIEENAIVLLVNGIGYRIFTASPYSYSIDENVRIYLYQHLREDECSLYGFKTKEEYHLFLRLIEVKGVGCKMVLPMFATGSIEGIIDAIERENILYLKKFPKIGDKVARQIILDLKGKLVSKENGTKEIPNSELAEALKALGYKGNDIKNILPRIPNSLTIEEQIREALKLLLK